MHTQDVPLTQILIKGEFRRVRGIRCEVGVFRTNRIENPRCRTDNKFLAGPS